MRKAIVSVLVAASFTLQTLEFSIAQKQKDCRGCGRRELVENVSSKNLVQSQYFF